VTIYSVIHSWCHLVGTFRIFVNEKDVDTINSHYGGEDFEEIPTYSELLFTTLPGTTGLMLLAIILVMAVTSMS